MGGTAIVAIPTVDDPVWKISSEKIPHLTLLFLGDQSENPEILNMVQFLQHLVDTSVYEFGLSVDYRGVLGDKEADVLFFDKGDHGLKMLKEARTYLLAQDAIFKAYNSEPQFPEWTPHLTLGYPDAPANEDDRDYPGLHWVRFDRLALWVGNFEGPEFRLQDRYSEEMAMSDEKAGSVIDIGAKAVANALAHYGVPGMKWGVRKDRKPSSVKVSQTPGKRVKAEGGENQPASEDAKKAAASRQKVRASTTDALSNDELKALVKRMQLEQQLSQLSASQKSAGRRFVEKLLGNTSQQQAARVANQVAAQQIDELLKNRGVVK